MQNTMADDQLFKVGASVEVSPDDIGLSGSWYEVTILSTIHKTKTKSTEKKYSYYDVEYKTLLDDEDETKLLKERVRASDIRPLPPPTPPEHRFKLNDVVDAFHRDGWWVGVISEILQHTGKFVVTFSFPPDQIECAASHLRVHLEWNHGVWVQPLAHADNQLEIEEKSLKKKRGRSSQELSGDGSSKNRSKRVKVLESRNQITRHCSSKPRKSVVILSSDDVTQDSVNVKRDKDGSEYALNKKVEEIGVHMGTQHPIKSKSDSLPQEMERNSALCLDDLGRSNNQLTCEKRSRSQNVQGVNDGLNKSERMDKETLDQAVSVAIAGRGNGSTFVNSSQESETAEKAAAIKYFYGSKFRNLGEELGAVNESAPEEEHGINVINLGQESRGIDNVEGAVGTKLGNKNEILESPIMDQGTAVDGYNNKSLNPMIEMATMEQPVAVEENEINSFVNPSQEKEIVDQATVQGNATQVINPEQEMEIIGGHTSAIVEGNVADCIRFKFPLKKTWALWSVVESMPFFQAIRQRPHFRSLEDNCPVHCREGKAIGYMLMYREVVEKTAKCTLDEDRLSIYEIFKALPKLEKNGFEVEVIRNHLNTLLEMKDEYDCFKNRLVEQNRKKEKVVNAIEDLYKQIKEMQEKCDDATLTKQNIDREMAEIESSMAALCQNFRNNVFEFVRETAA